MRPARAALLSLSLLACSDSVTVLTSDATGAGGAPATSSGSASATSTSSGAGASGAGSGEVASASVSASTGAGASGSSSGEVASVGASSSSSSGGGSGQGGAPPACAPGEEAHCYEGPPGTEGVGACKAGVRTCTEAGTWGACTGQVMPSPELCFDGIDQDCDGVLEPPSCCGGYTQCTDGIDNDGDGLVDAWDPECHGPLDNDEGSFLSGFTHESDGFCKRDCFFDGNSGHGDDKCFGEPQCDPLSPGAPKCPYDPSYAQCQTVQPPQCLESCARITPNGCDCFGCCDVFLSDGSARSFDLAGPGCTFEDATSDDPTHCRACTKNPSCDNPIAPCEYGIGKTKLPPECAPPVTNGCAEGQAACTPTEACPCGEYCLTGCCIKIPQ